MKSGGRGGDKGFVPVWDGAADVRRRGGGRINSNGRATW
jgi:hypothetical protein